MLKLPSFDYRQWYETEINTLEDVEKLFFHSEFKNGLYFRGMSKYEYICISTFYRHYLSIKPNIEWKESKIGYSKKILLPQINKEEYKRYSFEIIDEFKNHLIANGLNIINTNSIIYLAQHYGLPTNLIDFTTDPKIALYFACEKDYDEDCSVYMYDIFSHIKGLSQNLAKQNINSGEDLKTSYQYFFEKFTTTIENDTPDIATPIIQVDDIKYNQRIKNQKGVFVYHCDSIPFDNIMSLSSSQTSFDKRKIFKINSTLKENILIMLDNKYGINKDFLYPKICNDTNKDAIENAVLKTKEKFAIKQEDTS